MDTGLFLQAASWPVKQALAKPRRSCPKALTGAACHSLHHAFSFIRKQKIKSQERHDPGAQEIQ